MKTMNEFKEVFEDIVNSVTTSRHSSDYIQDGILYCGRCKTPKQTIVGDENERYVCPIMCKCEKERYEKEKHENEVRQLRDFCFRWIPDLKDCTFNSDTENGQVAEVCKRYVDIFDQADGLLLYGCIGTGKTFYAACICNAVIEKEKSAAIFSTSSFVDMNSSERKYIVNGLATLDAVVLDDLGTERDTGYGDEVIYSVVNRLYSSPAKMIITTNIPIEELSSCKETNKRRIYDRILQRCYPVKVCGESKRLEKGRENIRKMRKLLRG